MRRRVEGAHPEHPQAADGHTAERVLGRRVGRDVGRQVTVTESFGQSAHGVVADDVVVDEMGAAERVVADVDAAEDVLEGVVAIDADQAVEDVPAIDDAAGVGPRLAVAAAVVVVVDGGGAGIVVNLDDVPGAVVAIGPPAVGTGLGDQQPVLAVRVPGRGAVRRCDLGEATDIVVAVHGAVAPDRETAGTIAPAVRRRLGIGELGDPAGRCGVGLGAHDTAGRIALVDGADPVGVDGRGHPAIGVAFDAPCAVRTARGLEPIGVVPQELDGDTGGRLDRGGQATRRVVTEPAGDRPFGADPLDLSTHRVQSAVPARPVGVTGTDDESVGLAEQRREHAGGVGHRILATVEPVADRGAGAAGRDHPGQTAAPVVVVRRDAAGRVGGRRHQPAAVPLEARRHARGVDRLEHASAGVAADGRHPLAQLGVGRGHPDQAVVVVPAVLDRPRRTLRPGGGIGADHRGDPAPRVALDRATDAVESGHCREAAACVVLEALAPTGGARPRRHPTAGRVLDHGASPARVDPRDRTSGGVELGAPGPAVGADDRGDLAVGVVGPRRLRAVGGGRRDGAAEDVEPPLPHVAVGIGELDQTAASVVALGPRRAGRVDRGDLAADLVEHVPVHGAVGRGGGGDVADGVVGELDGRSLGVAERRQRAVLDRTSPTSRCHRVRRRRTPVRPACSGTPTPRRRARCARSARARRPSPSGHPTPGRCDAACRGRRSRRWSPRRARRSSRSAGRRGPTAGASRRRRGRRSRSAGRGRRASATSRPHRARPRATAPCDRCRTRTGSPPRFGRCSRSGGGGRPSASARTARRDRCARPGRRRRSGTAPWPRRAR